MKPHIKKHPCGLWECAGDGLHSLYRTPREAYDRWHQFKVRMRAED